MGTRSEPWCQRRLFSEQSRRWLRHSRRRRKGAGSRAIHRPSLPIDLRHSTLDESSYYKPARSPFFETRRTPTLFCTGAAVALPLPLTEQLHCVRWQCNCLASWFGSTTAEPVGLSPGLRCSLLIRCRSRAPLVLHSAGLTSHLVVRGDAELGEHCAGSSATRPAGPRQYSMRQHPMHMCCSAGT